MNFAKNFRFLRKEKGLSQNYVADKLGYKSFTTIQKWEDGTTVPPYSVITKLAEMFSIPVEDLMNSDLATLSSGNIPVLGIVRGGSPITAEQQYLGFEHVVPDDARHPDCFYLQVVGDSMKDARILPGDYLYVQRQNYLDNGAIGVVLVGNEATVKRVYFQGSTMVLQPENPDYSPIILDADKQKEENVQIIGKVLHNRIKF